jgi:catechol 2,3-dioxygenase-like lactoylglutathione lyase family enzyme
VPAPVAFQVTVDCDDPHAQARFWAAALGYSLEVDSAFVRRMVAEGHATDDDVVEIDGELFWSTGSAIRHPDAVDDPATARRAGNRVLFLRVPDRSSAKNAWHLDLNVGEDRIEDEVARLVALGAAERYRIAEHGARHVTLADPEGNLFCVQ